MNNLILTQADQTIIETEVKKVSENRQEILRSIHEAVLDRSMSDTGRITKVMARTSTLLVSLSEQADSIQKKMVWYTRVIAVLTMALFILTLVLLFR